MKTRITLKLNLQSTKPIAIIEDANRPSLSFDGSRIVVGPEIGLSEVYDVNNNKLLRTFKLEQSESEIISPNGNQVIIFHGDYRSSYLYSIFNVNDGKLIRTDEREILKNGKPTETLSVFNEGGLNSKNITSDFNLIAKNLYFDYDNPILDTVIIIGNLKNRSLVREFKIDDGFVSKDIWHQVSITSDGKYLASHRFNIDNRERNKVVVWNAITGKVIFSLPISASSHSLDDLGQTIAIKSHNTGQIKFWNVKTSKLISILNETVNGKKVEITWGVISPDGKIFVTTDDEVFYLWDTKTGKLIASQNQYKYSLGETTSITFSGNSKRLAIGSDTEVVTVWSIDEILKQKDLENLAVKPPKLKTRIL